MKLLTNTLLAILLAFSFTACQQSATKEESKANDVSAEQSENETETTESETSNNSGLINPNLATAEEMMTAGLSESTTQSIMDARPYTSMMTLHESLSSELDSADLSTLYGKLFIPFNINTEDEENFKIIPGVGDRMAHEFEEYRPYAKITQFRKEIGKYVDEEEVARLEQYIFIPVELNTASEEDILALPGVGERMAHEFEEYRPYTSMEQFRKEIGKYVDDKELARLERFVYLKEN